MYRAVSRPVVTSSSTERIRSSIARASTSARSAEPGSRASSACAIRSSARPSSTNIVWAARAGASAGSGGNRNELTASATAPPIAPSRIRSAVNPSALPGSSATSRTADTADSTTSNSPPPTAVAVAIASTTRTPICQAPVPITEISSEATVMPSTTPPTSWSARPVRSPVVTPTAITAAMAANAGRGSGSSATASDQAATAAIAFCTIGSMLPRRRSRAVVTAPPARAKAVDGRIITYP